MQSVTPSFHLPQPVVVLAGAAAEAKFFQSGNDLLVLCGETAQTYADWFAAPYPITGADGVELATSYIKSLCRDMLEGVSGSLEHLFDAATPLPGGLAYQPLSLIWGDSVLVRETAFDDVPETADECYFSIVAQGAHGLLTVDDMVLQTGDCFRWSDLTHDRLMYHHNETGGAHDRVLIQLIDPSTGNDKLLSLDVHINERLAAVG
jgi:hypothetical protein